MCQRRLVGVWQVEHLANRDYETHMPAGSSSVAAKRWDLGIVIAAAITIDGADFQQLDAMIEHAERELANAGFDRRPGVVLADAGSWQTATPTR